MSDSAWSDSIKVSFREGARVETTLSLPEEVCTVRFKNRDSGEVIFQTALGPDCWAAPRPLYYVNWAVEVISPKGLKVFSESLNLWGKRVLVFIDTPALGDTVAWAPYAQRFAAKHNCTVLCSSDYPELFTSDRTTKFVGRSDIPEHDIVYKIGYYYKPDWQSRVSRSVSGLSLQEVASCVLGLQHKELKPTIKIPDTPRPIEGKFVCIGVQSTAQCKLWNREDGWDKVVRYLKEKDFQVVCLDRHASFGAPNRLNLMPRGVIDKTGAYPLIERVAYLSHCEFFIGLGSGLSWLAWAVGKPVVMISGFSKPYAEFVNPHRVFNESVCNGCWNDETHPFDPGDWYWCPRKKDFECSKEITFEMVKEKIDLCMK